MAGCSALFQLKLPMIDTIKANVRNLFDKTGKRFGSLDLKSVVTDGETQS